MTIEQLKAWFVSRGYSQDKYGHFQKVLQNTPTQDTKSITYRYKIQDISIRKEVKCDYADGSHGWVRIASGYINKLSLNDKNQLVGMK